MEIYLSEVAPTLGAVISGQDVKLTGCSTDTRQIKPGAIYVALSGSRFDGHDFVMEAQKKGAGAVIVEKPVTCDLPTLRVTDTRKALGDLARFWRQRFDLPMVAITGSNGKTTTKEMLRAIFAQKGSVLANQGNFNNDIGVPLTLFNLQAAHRYAVIEMGANHAGEIGYLTQIAQPSVATITQCAPAHLEGFGSIKGVALAKGEIFSNLKSDGVAVINNDDEYANLWQQLAAPHQTSTFALDNRADVMATELRLNESGSDFTLQSKSGDIAIHLPLAGRHNVMNALAASVCALACGCTLDAIQQGLQNLQPVKGRLQRRAGINGISLIDDTYNANPASLNAALAVLSNNTSPYWLVLGDMNELGTESAEFHRQAGERAREFGVERLWAIGDMSRYAVESFGEGAKHFVHHNELIQSLRAQLPSRATVLIKGSRGMQMEKVVSALQKGT
jgi:UDP-N-acetylmuramoyl-tripeptide--D-alanyl-D-alanine ligase